jgi:hypothetical protein
MTHRYWQRVGGMLIEEYQLGRRFVDAVILLDGPTKISTDKRISLDGRDVIVVETKVRLNRPVLGQAIAVPWLIRPRFAPKSLRLIALCQIDDPELRPIFAAHGVEVVIDSTDAIVHMPRQITVGTPRLIRRLGYALRDGDTRKAERTRGHLAARAATGDALAATALATQT